MKRLLVLGYGVVVYATFLGVFAALVGFLADAGLVRGIDDGEPAPLGVGVGVDAGLLALFGASHSVMARPWFKARWTRLLPAVVERSTYVLVASVILAATIALWQPLPRALWRLHAPALRVALWAIFSGGVALIVFSTFLTDHFDLFGLRQAWMFARGRPYAPPRFQERGLYRHVRHPMMLGMLVWLWAAPTMSVGHLVFSLGLSVYVAIGIHFEDRDLAGALGEPYRAYRRRVGALLPRRR